MGEIEFAARLNDEVDATVLGAAFGGIVGGDGVELGVSGGGKPVGWNCFESEHDPRDAGGACCGEFPVGVELGVMDGDVVSVSLDTKVVRSVAE